MPDPRSSWPAGLVALVPLYNHAPCVAAVVSGLKAHGAIVLCVDDGSTDDGGALAAAAGAQVRRWSDNRGKGAALRAGLSWAESLGFSQVLTCDADGQHPPDAAAQLARDAAADPRALHLGVRAMTDAPFASRLGRFATNCATWTVCGTWPGDNQTGLRVYPLPVATRLNVRAGRFAFEAEHLVAAMRAGVALRRHSVPVRYPPDRVSHFRALVDTARTTAAFARMGAGRFLPRQGRSVLE